MRIEGRPAECMNNPKRKKKKKPFWGLLEKKQAKKTATTKEKKKNIRTRRRTRCTDSRQVARVPADLRRVCSDPLFGSDVPTTASRSRQVFFFFFFFFFLVVVDVCCCCWLCREPVTPNAKGRQGANDPVATIWGVELVSARNARHGRCHFIEWFYFSVDVAACLARWRLRRRSKTGRSLLLHFLLDHLDRKRWWRLWRRRRASVSCRFSYRFRPTAAGRPVAVVAVIAASVGQHLDATVRTVGRRVHRRRRRVAHTAL